MSEELKKALKEIEELKSQVNKITGKNEDGIPIFSFSNITYLELEAIVDIKHNFNDDIFNNWFNNNIQLNDDIICFLVKLLEKEGKYLKYYYEENLKIKFLTPILNNINFNIKYTMIKDFYEEKLTYKTDKFILNGTIDFTVSKGEVKSEKPYFFIQEFKKGKVSTDPEPQLLAELISAIELNDEISMKGAYIVGSIWNFVILEKLGEDKYQYFVSQNFDSTKTEDLKAIYTNLLFIKNEIIEKIKDDEK